MLPAGARHAEHRARHLPHVHHGVGAAETPGSVPEPARVDEPVLPVTEGVPAPPEPVVIHHVDHGVRGAHAVRFARRAHDGGRGGVRDPHRESVVERRRGGGRRQQRRAEDDHARDAASHDTLLTAGHAPEPGTGPASGGRGCTRRAAVAGRSAACARCPKPAPRTASRRRVKSRHAEPAWRSSRGPAPGVAEPTWPCGRALWADSDAC